MINDSLMKIRRMIKDENKSIFSDDQILQAYNMIREEVLMTVPIRVQAKVVPSIPVIGCTYKWESLIVDESSWQFAFVDESGKVSTTQEWEVQLLQGIDVDIPGGYTTTGGAGIDLIDYNNSIVYPLPEDFYAAQMVAWNCRNILAISFRALAKMDYNWAKRKSDEVQYVCLDKELGNNNFVPYPFPTTLEKNISGNGIVNYSDVEGWNSSEGGLAITARGIEIVESESGVISDVEDIGSGFLIIYQVVPIAVNLNEEDYAVPRCFRKYIEFGVVSDLLRADTELYNTDKSDVYKSLYNVGLLLIQEAWNTINNIKRHSVKEIGDRFTGNKRPLGRPKFPSGYPKVW